ncbi:MAG: pitrilysin family protein [Vicinamibacterales bacterium]|jgi:zinc protease|nr:hypothetical protein [Acidobacteriota bacterium]MDP6372494.1 pitrilysin family protein [Vicinamibacterales bacterium]MDP6610470.1 pitrilysin family protein [Vicinamibacterales bacterium]HAK53879.1 hypothetical protein [Acidobacteriota bacterium]|tara:strand:- start:9432 stop:10718 length:1287 start_codon:yes stop_codon:yes gene_type:complete
MSPTALSPARTVLPNGVVLLTQRTTTQPAVAIDLVLRTGSVHDPVEHLGVANFAAHVIDQGTTSRSAEQLAEAFDDRGIALEAYASRHRFGMTCTCLASDAESVLALVADIVRRPSFPDDRVATRRVEIETGIRRDADSPAETADALVRALIYGETHPYGRRTSGTLESLARIDRQAIADFHRTHCAPERATLTIVGDIDPGAALDVASRGFGDWTSPPPPPEAALTPAASNGRRRAVRSLPGKVQADVAYGFAGITRSDARYHAFWIMNNVLGQYGLGGRLGDSIRERQGMAYYVFSELEANVGPGPLIIRAGVSPDNVERAIASIDEEVGMMGRDGVSDKELADAKQYLIGSIPRMLETNARIAAFLQTVEQFDLGLDYDARLAGLLEAVSLEEVREAAASLLAPDRAAVAVAGPIDSASGEEART